MLVYKFGGASINSPERIKNLVEIVSRSPGKKIIVVSAMGKVTNALEAVNAALTERDANKALNILSEVENYHHEMIKDLDMRIEDKLKPFFDEIVSFVETNTTFDFDFCYGKIVSLGELLSSVIVNEYLNRSKIASTMVDARKFIMTDSIFREAKVYFDKTENNIKRIFSFDDTDCYITQGFIGSNPKGDTTTLGREGSDYSAAIIASLTNAESLTIWKDVPGVLSADPKLFPEAELLDELSYKDAAELSYYGAQVMHPKTIKPLANRNIPLFVRSFLEPDLPGTCVSSNKIMQNLPVIATKKNQILISVLPKDFSFASEHAVSEILDILHAYHLKIQLIQSTPLCISLCTDDERNTRMAIDELKMNGLVLYNDNLELITIRNYTPELIEKHSRNRERLIMQCDRATVRILLK